MKIFEVLSTTTMKNVSRILLSVYIQPLYYYYQCKHSSTLVMEAAGSSETPVIITSTSRALRNLSFLEHGTNTFFMYAKSRDYDKPWLTEHSWIQLLWFPYEKYCKIRSNKILKPFLRISNFLQSGRPYAGDTFLPRCQFYNNPARPFATKSTCY